MTFRSAVPVAIIVALLAVPSTAVSSGEPSASSSGSERVALRLNKLGVGLSEAVAPRILVQRYGGKWRYGYARQISFVRRLSRIRVRLSYEFNHRFSGYLTIWRSRPGYLSWHLFETTPD